MDRLLLLAAIAALLGTSRAADGDPAERDPRFTGNPQIDWEFDPNYPRELRGYNMTDYPFLSRPPPKMKFTCRDRIDGFYANIDYKCQVYHHCLYGIRQDFLCANYTAFDMSAFICQFVNSVDCEGSDKFIYRNEPLYKFTTTVKPPRRRPFREEQLPASEDYYYDDYYDTYYDNYYDEPATTTTTTTTTTTRRPLRRRPGHRRRRPGGRRRPQRRRRPQPVYDYADYPEEAPIAAEERRKAAAPAPAAVDTAYPDYEYAADPAPVRQQTRRRRPGGVRVGGRRRPAAQATEAAPPEPEAAPTRRPPQPAPVPEVAVIENEVLDAAPHPRPGGRRRPAGGSRRGGLGAVRRPAPAPADPDPAPAPPRQDPSPAPPRKDPVPARRQRPAQRRRPQPQPQPQPQPEYDYYDYPDEAADPAPAAQEVPVYDEPAAAPAPAPAPARRRPLRRRGRGGRQGASQDQAQ